MRMDMAQHGTVQASIGYLFKVATCLSMILCSIQFSTLSHLHAHRVVVVVVVVVVNGTT